jgi:hypothetical protein
VLPLDDAKQKACDHYNQRQMERERWDDDWREAMLNSESKFLQRITVNYLRHRLSRYERDLEEIFGKVGVREAYQQINQKVYTAIAVSYPELKAECERQLAAKREIYSR